MADVLTRAGCFVVIILMGYVLRKINFFKEGDFQVLSRIVIKITLTAAIITNFAGQTLDYSMFLMSAMGLIFGFLCMGLGYLVNGADGRESRAFAVLNTSGVNIGNFVLPFVSSFLGPVAVMSASLFDLGNSFICLGGAYSIASIVKEGSGRIRFKPILKALFSSIPLVTYLIMTVLCLLHIALPKPVTELAGIIGNANAFMAMLMIGVGFRLQGDRSQLGTVARILLVRYTLGAVLAALVYCLLPLPLAYRQAAAVLFMGPIASAAPAFTEQMKGDYGLSCAVNSVSILISIGAITGLLLII